MLQPFWLRVPLMAPIDGETSDAENVDGPRVNVNEQIPCLLPWDVAHAISAAGQDCWQEALYDSAENGTTAEHYWSLAVTQKWGLLHPITEVDRSLWNDVIPFWIHVDDVQITDGSGAPTPHTVYSWLLALTTGSTISTKFYLGL